MLCYSFDEASMELLSRVYTVLYEMLHMEEASTSLKYQYKESHGETI